MKADKDIPSSSGAQASKSKGRSRSRSERHHRSKSKSRERKRRGSSERGDSKKHRSSRISSRSNSPGRSHSRGNSRGNSSFHGRQYSPPRKRPKHSCSPSNSPAPRPVSLCPELSSSRSMSDHMTECPCMLACIFSFPLKCWDAEAEVCQHMCQHAVPPFCMVHNFAYLSGLTPVALLTRILQISEEYQSCGVCPFSGLLPKQGPRAIRCALALARIRRLVAPACGLCNSHNGCEDVFERCNVTDDGCR